MPLLPVFLLALILLFERTFPALIHQPEQQPVFPEQPSVLAPFSDREASAEG